MTKIEFAKPPIFHSPVKTYSKTYPKNQVPLKKNVEKLTKKPRTFYPPPVTGLIVRPLSTVVK